ncbi:MAG: hypothetical protein EAZ07_08315 [Cytophagales bacterium]|nr:MAG: hypothetical protein EAZ07_08315 [Cytophagales bacterium]
MATNTYKIPQENASKVREGNSVFKKIERLVKFQFLFVEGLPVQYLPKVLFVSILLIFYIGNAHFAEKKIRQIEKMKVEVEDIRADYTTLKSELMFASKQSEVAKKVSIIGLEESSVPPIKINQEE